MSVPQFGIFAQGTVAHYFLEFDLRRGVDLDRQLDAIGRLRTPAVSAGGVNLVVAFGAHLWRQIAPNDAPSDLKPFPGVTGADGRVVPATQHDIWLWISGSTSDVVFEHARAATKVLKSVATLAVEQPCFVHRDSRDLTGFIDGTANPQQLDAPLVALVPEGQVGEGGSHVIAIRWIHDLAAFEKLPVADQQRVFGRTKPHGAELAEEVKPRTAHIARVELEDSEGRELEIYRRSVPYGSVKEHGLYFVAFSSEPTRYERMLSRMFGAEDGQSDRLMDFSRPVSGSFYFAPSLTLLAKLTRSRSGDAEVVSVS